MRAPRKRMLVPWRASIPDALKAWRGRWRLTQAQAAAALGVPISTLIKWEQGARRPGGLALELLKTKLQNPPD